MSETINNIRATDPGDLVTDSRSTTANSSLSFLEKYTGHGQRSAAGHHAERIDHGDYASTTSADHADDLDAEEDCGCFGWLRGARDRSVMLELRKRDGNIQALGYSWMERVEYDPSVGITLHALGRSIRIKGRNLNTIQSGGVRLFDGIIRHRVTWIQEADGQAGEHGGREVAVAAAIEW